MKLINLLARLRGVPSWNSTGSWPRWQHDGQGRECGYVALAPCDLPGSPVRSGTRTPEAWTAPCRRVLRGGSSCRRRAFSATSNRPGNLRPANRNRSTTDNRSNNIGFRVASTLSAGAGATTVAPGGDGRVGERQHFGRQPPHRRKAGRVPVCGGRCNPMSRRAGIPRRRTSSASLAGSAPPPVAGSRVGRIGSWRLPGRCVAKKSLSGRVTMDERVCTGAQRQLRSEQMSWKRANVKGDCSSRCRCAAPSYRGPAGAPRTVAAWAVRPMP